MALMCALINLKALSFDTKWEVISSILTITILIMAIIVPIVFFVAIWLNFYQLNEQGIKDKFGAVYEQQRLKRDNTKEFHRKTGTSNKTEFSRKFFFCSFMIYYYFRRFLFGLTLVYFKITSLQLMSIGI